MAALMRTHDWERNALGAPAGWPPVLKTTLRLLLSNNHPMLLLWGTDLRQFYNDAYRQTLGDERHPSPLGQPARECWNEVWDIIGPQIDLVMSGQGATWNENHLIPVTRQGHRENIYWTYSYNPIEDEAGVRGVLVICNDVTKEHECRQSLERLNENLAMEVEMRTQAQTALAAERDRIDAALERSQDDLGQQVSDWQRLHAMSSKLLQAHTLVEQFAVVLKTVADFHRCTQGVVSLYDAKRGGLITQASLGVSEQGLHELACVPVGAGACGKAFQEKRRIFVEDTDIDPLYKDYREFANGERVRALYSTPFFTQAGEPLGVLSIYFSNPRKPDERELRLTDICISQIALFVERALAEKQLHEMQNRSHRILESMKEGFILMDQEFHVLQINAEGLRMDGRPAEQIIGRTHWELWPGTEDIAAGHAYKNVMRDRVPVALEQCYQHAGREMWLDIRAYPHDEGIVLLYRDITEHKRAEEKLVQVIDETERRRRLYETVLSNTPDLVYVFDLDHRFSYANEVLLTMWGKTWDEAIGKNCLELGYEPWHAEMHGREIEQVKATRQPIRGEVPFNGTFGPRIYEYIFVPVLGPNNEVEAVAGTTRDVTERKQIEVTLREANLRKDEFLAMLAHELRNPLAPISAAADLLQLVHLDAERLKQTSQVISRQVRHMTGLVDDLLDVSRVTRGVAVMKKNPQDFKSIVSSAVEQARPLVESKRHQLVLELPAAPAHVLGDQKRLVQIVANVLNNAAKYTPEGGRIDLKMEVTDEQLMLTVIDNGVGIAPELQPRIFELFTQAERSPDRSQGGLGIGLALVKSLLDLHGGQIQCISEGVGKGSHFTISLPRLTATESGASGLHGASQLPAPARQIRVMIVDDNADAAQMLAMYLEAFGHLVSVAHHAEQALQFAATEAPDLCLLDIGLPGIDGNELARRLRSNARLKKAVLIAVTGYGQEQDKKNALAAGFDYHITKPVDFEYLNRLICDLVLMMEPT